MELSIWLNEDDANRLFAIMEQEGNTKLSANEFAKEMLVSAIHRRHPSKVVYEDEE